MVAAPLQHVHGHPRRVGELDEEELLAGDVLDPGRIRAAREDVEAVQADAERGVVGALDDPPRVLVVVDVATPGERLVGDPQAVGGGALGQLAQLGGGQRVVVDRVRRDVRAHQQQLGAELLHQRELRLGAREVRLGHGLEVPKRLVEIERQVAVRRAAARICAGRSGDAIRSGSNSSTPSKPACAAASSFSSSVPLRQTVAIERLTPSAPRSGAASARGRDAGR